jgi:2-haloacid dehalogenase
MPDPSLPPDPPVATAGGRPPRTRALVFDLGGVLIDWDPRHLYRQLFDDADDMERFLAEVTSAEWNLQQDAGRPWAEAIEALVRAFPERRDLIEAYHARWPEMMAGAIDGTVDILAELRAAGRPLYALSNWSSETFPHAQDRFPFLSWFDGVVISGDVGLVKPDPRLFRLLLERYDLVARETIYIDDQPANVRAAAALGLIAIQFRDAAALRTELERLRVVPGS